ncbi:MAG: cephalosporin hydroxylase [Acidobacteria bacterium]|nr:cephalosporin hydroxylase [Acidobacteriota bacterium]
MPLMTEWIEEATRLRYPYKFTWLGQPVIQFPADVVAIQELLWEIKPEAVVETGIAHGGSLLLHASILELIGGPGMVYGIDIDIRPPNRHAIESHRLSHRIELIEGSSVDPEVADRVWRKVTGRSPVMVILDSNHSHDHVARELELYTPLIGRGGYLIVGDTIIDDFPPGSFDRPWDQGNNPKTALRAFLQHTDRFQRDLAIEDKLLMTCNPEGWLRCIQD